MALQKQLVRMSIVDGLDTKTDEKNVIATKFLELENGVFTKTGALSKRPGYEEIPNETIGGGSLPAGQALTTFKNELLAFANNSLYTFSEGENQFASKGLSTVAVAKEESVISNGFILTNPSHATINGVRCVAYATKNTTGGLTSSFRIIDVETGAVLLTQDVNASLVGTTEPYVQALGDYFAIFFIYAGDLKVQFLHYDLTMALSTVTPITTLASRRIYDVKTIGNKIIIVTPDATGVKTFYVNSSYAIVTGPVITDIAYVKYLTVNLEGTDDIRITYAMEAPYVTGNCKTVLYANNFSTVLHAPIVIFSSFAVNRVVAIRNPTVTTSSHIYVDATGEVVEVGNVTASASFTILAGYNQAMIQSKPQIFGEHSYILLRNLKAAIGVTPIDTYYLMSDRVEILAQYLPGAAVFAPNPVDTEGPMPNVEINGEMLDFIGVGIAEAQPPGAVTLQTPTLIKTLTADFSQAVNYFDSVLGDNLHISGGVLKMYDSDKIVEHNFVEIPATPQFISETATGAVLPDGTYQYTYCYAWRDKFGQVHRSAPAVPLTYVLTGGPKKPSIRFFFLAFTAKENAYLELYRTEANGTIFYNLAFNFADRVPNTPNVASYVFADTVDDATLITHETLYTTGGVLENIAASPSSYITSYKNRIFLLLADGKTLQYSKLREQNGPVEFNDALKINLDEKGGNATALAVMDDNLIIFKERGIFTMNGDGPNNLGEQDDYRAPVLITSDAGCIEPNSVVTVPNGIMFKSEKGIYMLQRGFAVQYIGAPVEGYNNLTITSATLIADTNQVRFTTTDNRVLVYDYYHNRWTTFTNIDALDAIIYKDKYTYLASGGAASVFAENNTIFTDNGAHIPMNLVSAWIQIAEMQGFERFYKLLILGDYKGDHQLKVSFAYNFIDTYIHDCIIDATASTSPLYQWAVFPKIQKCESFKFKIEDILDVTANESLSLSNFAAEIGIKGGKLFPKSNAQSVAAK